MLVTSPAKVAIAADQKVSPAFLVYIIVPYCIGSFKIRRDTVFVQCKITRLVLSRRLYPAFFSTSKYNYEVQYLSSHGTT
jgi:hypothetical protein